MPSKTWETGRPKKNAYEKCFTRTNKNGSRYVVCEGTQRDREKVAKNKKKAKDIKKTGGKSGRTKAGESTTSRRKQTSKQYRAEVDKPLKDFTKEQKRIYNNLVKAESRARTGRN
tara:strand:+ start:1977 stop:2321 length:345 start_codon:yes stop_codon:yes gene_type:complete